MMTSSAMRSTRGRNNLRCRKVLSTGGLHAPLPPRRGAGRGLQAELLGELALDLLGQRSGGDGGPFDLPVQRVEQPGEPHRDRQAFQHGELGAVLLLRGRGDGGASGIVDAPSADVDRAFAAEAMAMRPINKSRLPRRCWGRRSC
jgi:hypothetical protein